jgi:hypothetical protein
MGGGEECEERKRETQNMPNSLLFLSFPWVSVTFQQNKKQRKKRNLSFAAIAVF